MAGRKSKNPRALRSTILVGDECQGIIEKETSLRQIVRETKRMAADTIDRGTLVNISVHEGESRRVYNREWKVYPDYFG